MRRQTAVLFTGLSGLIFFTPFFFGSVHAWGFMSLAAVLFLLQCGYPQFFLEIKEIPKIPRQFVIGVLFAIYCQMAVFSVDRHAGLLQCILWTALAGGFLLIQLLDEMEIRKLLGVFVLTALFQVLYSFWQSQHAPEMVLWRLKEAHLGYWTGTFLNRNHLAGFLEMSLGISMGFFLVEADRKTHDMRVWIWSFICFILLCGLLRTGSRFGCGVFMTLAFAAGLRLMLKQSQIRPWMFLLAVGGMVLLYTQSGALLQRFSLEDTPSEAAGGRWWVWQDALKLFQHYLWTGTGLGGFGRAFPQYQSARLLMGWEHAHNDYLELMIELGLPLFLLWMAGWVSLGWNMGLRFIKLKTRRCWLAGGILLGLISVALHGIVDFNFSVPANRFSFILLTGCAYRLLFISPLQSAGELEL